MNLIEALIIRQRGYSDDKVAQDLFVEAEALLIKEYERLLKEAKQKRANTLKQS
jgi:hypothetical protein